MEKIKHITATECIVSELLNQVRQSECNDCGKCVFGYEGITQLTLILQDITEKKAKNSDYGLIRELAGVMRQQSICEIGVGIAETVLDALVDYESDFMSHIGKKSCPAGVCKKFLNFYILPELCSGCNDCIDECDDEAIMGKKRFIHVIDQDECVQCGKCVSACEEHAIIIAGAVKPRVPKKPIPVKR